MGSESAVVEISSDDEEDFSLDNLDSLDWVAGLLDFASGKVDEADDVMVLDEFSSAPPVKQKKNFESLRPAGGSAGDESDDDCLVLESDPDKPVSSVDKGDGGDGLDDVLIVGEKGQLACRDYPHPRHLCLNFPFSTTSHEKHCNLCHCYVCDSPAPCIYWGNGSASTNHCHSTDKDGKWKVLRQFFKQKNITTSQPQKPPDVALSMMPSFQNPAPLCHSKTSLLSIPSFRSSVLRPCTATRCAASDPPNQRHQQNLAPLSYHGQRLSHHPSKSHPLNPRTQYAHRRIRAGGTFTARLVHSHTKFKRVGTTRVGPVILNENRSACSVSNNNQLQGNVSRRSHFTTITSQRSQRRPATSQRSQCPPVTSQRPQRPPLSPSQRSCSTPVTSQVSQCTPGTSVEDGVNQIYRTAAQSSNCVPVTSQSSQCLPITPANDNMKSWQDMLARVASELGVSDSNSRDSAPTVKQPVMVSSQPLSFSQFDSETNVSQDVDFYGPSLPEVTNLNSLDFDCGWSNPAAQSIQENGQGVDPQPKNVQPSDSLVSGSKMDPGEIQLDSFLCSIGELVAETPKDTELPELDPVTLLCDLEATWSGLEPV